MSAAGRRLLDLPDCCLYLRGRDTRDRLVVEGQKGRAEEILFGVGGGNPPLQAGSAGAGRPHAVAVTLEWIHVTPEIAAAAVRLGEVADST